MAFATASTIGLALTAVGTGVSVFGQLQQAKAAEAAGEFNARLARQEAELQNQTTLENIRRQRANNRRFLARQRALFAAKGIALEGSALEVLGKSASNLETGIQDAFQQGQLSVNRSFSQANLENFNAGQASSAAKTSAFGTVLSGATQFTKSLI